MFPVSAAAQRILKGAAATITTQLHDQNGIAVVPGGVVTVDVARADGAVVATGASTVVSGTTASYTLAAQADLDLLTFTWKDAGTARKTTTVEVVGGFYFSVDEAHNFDTAIAVTPDAQIVAVRREVEDECEQITGRAWVPRYRREPVSWWSGNQVVLDQLAPRRVRSLRTYSDSTTFVEETVSTLRLEESGVVEFDSWSSAEFQTVIAYEYGYDNPPADLKHACLTRLRSRLKMESTGIPDRATSFLLADGGGAFAIATPGRAGFETGIPDVDAVYHRYSAKSHGLV